MMCMACSFQSVCGRVYPQVDPVSDWRLFCKAHAHPSVVERLGHAAQLEVDDTHARVVY